MRTNAVVLAMGALLAAAPLAAQTKVGFVNIDQVTMKSKSVSSLVSGMQTDLRSLQKEVDAKRTKITDLENEVKRTEGVVAKSATDEKRKEIQRLRNEIDEIDFKLRQQMRDVEQTVLEPLKRQITTAIEEVAREQRYDIVLTREAVIFAMPAVDLTDDVIKKLNTDSKPASAKPAAKETDGKPEPAKETDAPKPEAQSPKTDEAKPEPEAAVTPAPPAATPDERTQALEPTPAEEAKPSPKPDAAEKPSGAAAKKRAVDRQPE
jgi:outer membrane protein